MVLRRITLQREELYERVWTTPLQELAREHKLAGTPEASLAIVLVMS